MMKDNSQYPKNVTVWIALISNKLNEPYFLKRSINAEHFLRNFENFVTPNAMRSCLKLFFPTDRLLGGMVQESPFVRFYFSPLLSVELFEFKLFYNVMEKFEERFTIVFYCFSLSFKFRTYVSYSRKGLTMNFQLTVVIIFIRLILHSKTPLVGRASTWGLDSETVYVNVDSDPNFVME